MPRCHHWCWSSCYPTFIWRVSWIFPNSIAIIIVHTIIISIYILWIVILMNNKLNFVTINIFYVLNKKKILNYTKLFDKKDYICMKNCAKLPRYLSRVKHVYSKRITKLCTAPKRTLQRLAFQWRARLSGLHHAGESWSTKNRSVALFNSSGSSSIYAHRHI